jgi:hypothetical protein
VDVQAFADLGCAYRADGNFEVMKSPVGDTAWCQSFASSRIRKLAGVWGKKAQLPSAQAGIYLLRYQASRMIYTVRTTPFSKCDSAIAQADKVIETTAACLLGTELSKEQAERARMPTRLGGLGLQSLTGIADAAYIASYTACRARIAALSKDSVARHSGDTAQQVDAGSFLAAAADRIASRLPGGRGELDGMTDNLEEVRQRKVSVALRAADAERLLCSMNIIDAATFQASRAPGACRWLLPPPMLEGDDAFTNELFTTAVKQQLGVALDVRDSCRLCKFCGAVRDDRGIHDRSCTSGGDIVIRHNAVRDLLFSFAQRGQLHPVLERVGLLAEPGILLDMRRPADVLIEGALNTVPGVPGSSAVARLALDVKVINALGQGHLPRTRQDPLAAAEAYHDHVLVHEQTKSRCSRQGITYVPMVFTAQGGIAKRAEAIMHQLAKKVAGVEHRQEHEAFEEIVESVSRCLARYGARAIARRSFVRAAEVAAATSASSTLWQAIGRATTDDLDDDDEEC